MGHIGFRVSLQQRDLCHPQRYAIALRKTRNWQVLETWIWSNVCVGVYLWNDVLGYTFQQRPWLERVDERFTVCLRPNKFPVSMNHELFHSQATFTINGVASYRYLSDARKVISTSDIPYRNDVPRGIMYTDTIPTINYVSQWWHTTSISSRGFGQRLSLNRWFGINT